MKTIAAILLAACGVTGSAVHPQASVEETEYAQGIQALQWHDGKLYSGYGDASRNTGPVSITPWTHAGWLPTEFVFGTEAIYVYREIDGKLYAPAIDPGDGSEYAVYSDGAWVARNVAGFAHVFDVVEFQDQICINGSIGVDAAVWCGTDGGSWREVLRRPPPAGTSFVRANFLFEHGGYLYTQLDDRWDTPGLRFDGSTWTEVAPIVYWGVATEPHDFNGQQLLLAGNTLTKFTPTTTKTRGNKRFAAPPQSSPILNDVRDFTVADGAVWAVKTNGDVVRSTDLSGWVTVKNVPGALTVTAEAGTAYVGLPNGVIEYFPS